MRGTSSAEATAPPELLDHPRNPPTKSDKIVAKRDPARAPGSLGPVDRKSSPTGTADNPRCRGKAASYKKNGTDKGIVSHSPQDNEEKKKYEIDMRIRTAKGRISLSPLKNSESTTMPTTPAFFSSAGSTLPSLGGMPPPGFGRALTCSDKSCATTVRNTENICSTATTAIVIPPTLLSTTTPPNFLSLGMSPPPPSGEIFPPGSGGAPSRTDNSRANPAPSIANNNNATPTGSPDPILPLTTPISGQQPRRSARIANRNVKRDGNLTLPMPAKTLSNPQAYDAWVVRSYGYLLPGAGTSTCNQISSKAPSPLPAAGSTRVAGVPLGSALVNTNSSNPGYGQHHSSSIPSLTGSYVYRPFPPQETPSLTKTTGNTSQLTTSRNQCRRTGPSTTKKTNLALQWNVNGLFNNLGDLEALVRDSNPSVIVLQEVNRVSPTRINSILGGKYIWYTKRGQVLQHSVAIGVSSSVPHSQVPVSSDLPIVAVRVLLPIPITIANVYLPCGRINMLKPKLIDALQPLEEPRVVLGDFNAHHPNWGLQAVDVRGNILAELFEEMDLSVLNDGSGTFTRGRSETAIDISVASLGILSKLSWFKHNDLHGSDHYPIAITYEAAPPAITRRPRWKYSEADWTTFSLLADLQIANKNPTDVVTLTDIIRQAAEETIPKSKPIPGRRALHWWSDEVKAAVKRRRKLLRAAKKLPADHVDKQTALEAYRKQNNCCRQLIRKAKTDSWTDFLESINAEQTAADLWGKVNSLNGKKKTSHPIIRFNGTLHNDPTTTANILGEYFAELSSIDDYSLAFSRRNDVSLKSISTFEIPPDHFDNSYNRPFNIHELNIALKTIKGASSGPDDIGYAMLKNLSHVGRTALLDTFNWIWMNKEFPKQWQHSLIVPIPKVGQSNNEPSGYRPISLTSCISKTMERMVNKRLIDTLEENNKLDHRQFAFRPGRGTNTYFATLGSILMEAKERGQHIEAVALDLSKAYNRTWTPLVLKTLVDWGFCGNLLEFVKGFLTDRTYEVIIGNTRSRVFREETGVPQGSVLAVTLFLVAMDSIFDDLPKGMFILVYADDILLLAVGNTHREPRRRIQAATNAVGKWAKNRGFTISATKSVHVIICPTKHRSPSSAVSINNNRIPFKRTIKVLGVVIDSSLSFNMHFNKLKQSCKTRINLLKTIAKPHRSNNRDIRLRVAKAIIDSRLTYGLELTCIAKENLIKILAPIYNNCLRIISGLLPSTPAVSACVEIGALPFDLSIDVAIIAKTISFLEKTSGSEEIYLIKESDRILQKINGTKLPRIAELLWYGAKQWDDPLVRTESSIKSSFKAGDNSAQMKCSVLELLRGKYADYQKIFTDGSKSRHGVGLGVHSSDDSINISSRIPDICSVFSAEAAAILVAVNQPSTNPTVIVSDSASVIEALQADTPQHPWIQAILQQAPPSTTFMWVPGHCGVPGNTVADHLASTGHNGELLTREVPLQDVKLWIRNIIRQYWATKWSHTEGPFIRKIKGVISRFEDLPSLKEQKILSRLRTGHCKVSHNMGGQPFHILCNYCKVQNTVEHFMCVCPVYEPLRVLHGITGSIRDVLGDDKAMTAALFRFLKDAKLFFNI